MNDTRAPFGARVFLHLVRGLIVWSVVAALFGFGCGCEGPGSGEKSKEENVTPSRPIDEVLAVHSEELLARPGVTIVYQGARDDGAPCITVGVVDKNASSARSLPKSIEGYPVVVQETGAVGPR
jgi:hypothetical protein